MENYKAVIDGWVDKGFQLLLSKPDICIRLRRIVSLVVPASPVQYSISVPQYASACKTTVLPSTILIRNERSIQLASTVQ